MITIISGKPGVGKTALLTYFCERTYQSEREWLLKSCIERIELLNESRERPLTLPTAPPIYTNYEVQFHVGYEEYYEPFFVNPYYLGMPSSFTQNVPPNSRIFISEAQRYYNSRKSSTFPDWVSRWYEMHRHFGINVYMDVQRGKLIDLNIRELCKKFIEVQSMEHELSSAGWIKRTRWRCREFDNMQDFDEYVDGKGANYVETEYVYEGCIFSCFNSTSCFNEFVPPEDSDFDFLPYNKTDENKAAFYDRHEPETYRKPEKAKPKEKEKKNAA